VTRPYSLGEIAILFRTGRQAAPLEEALLAEGIPYRILGQRALLGAPEVREALDILRFVDRPTDLRYTIALREGSFAPGAAVLGQIREYARAAACSPIDATAELLRAGRFTIAVHERLQGFLDFTADLRARAADTGAGDLLLRSAPTAKGEPPRALIQVARAAGRRPLGEFLLRLATGQEGDHERREDPAKPGEGITLLTMHAAKGLEFPAVFLVGLAEGIMPWRSAEDDEALAEERRLFFVSLTRAAEMLILVGPPEDGDREPSRFLRELPAEAVEKAGAAVRKKKAAQQGLF
jgi:superfamily I DNA/RNA helicase